MSLVPLHPQFVHLPLALSIILPILCVVVILLIIRKKVPAIAVWSIVVGLQVLTTASGYLAMEMGGKDEDVVETVVGKDAIHEHEEKAEMFVALTVAASVVSIATLLVPGQVQVYLMSVTLILMLAQSFLGFRAGQSGGELVYVHKAANAFKNEAVHNEGLLPTPGMQTSESPANEDDHDYSPSESSEEEDDEEEKDQ